MRLYVNGQGIVFCPLRKQIMTQMHLNKSGSGMASKTACGRNVLRTPMSTNWENFKNQPEGHQCEKCAASKQAALNAKMDAKKSPVAPVAEEKLVTIGCYVPEKSKIAMAKWAAKLAEKQDSK